VRAAWIVGLLLVASCGKQLNPEYCTHNPTDPDCQMPGVVQLDAAARCSADTDCTGSVCDTMSGACVQCTTSNHSLCTGTTLVCSQDDTCVACNTGSDCAASGVCLPDSTCASSSTILYAAPNGSGDCSGAGSAACTLTKAVSEASPTKNVIQLQNGTFNEGSIALGVPGLQLVVAAAAKVTITGSNNGKPLFAVTANASISQVTLDKSSGDGVQCSESATLTLGQVVISNSNGNAITANSCNLTVTRSKLFGNSQSAIATDGTTTVSVLNNFMYANGTSTDQLGLGGYTGGGAVALGGKTSGQVRFNTIGFNNAADVPIGKHSSLEYPAGFSCGDQVSSSFNFSDNLLVNDSPVEYAENETCGNQSPTGANWIGNASDVDFVSTSSSSMDLHLTPNTPDSTQDKVKAVRDNADTNCMNVLNDYDNDGRPYNAACDYGADEFTPAMM
jgi:hypothetical protein